MRASFTIIKRLSYAAGILLLLLVCAAFLLPKFINTVPVKDELQRILSQKISGTLTFRSIDLSLFPVPRLIMDQPRIALPGRVEASIASLKVFPEIIPFFRGQVKITKLQIRNPVLTLHVSDRESGLPSVEQISAALTSMTSDAAGLILSVENGRFSLIRNGHEPAVLRQVDARVVVESKEDRITVTLDRLKVMTPRLLFAGVFSIRPASPRLSLYIKGTNLPVQQTGGFALAAAGEMPPVRNITDIVRDGTVPDITFESGGDTFEELGAIKNIEIKGGLEQGGIHIPGLGLDFTAVQGAFTVSKGILQGTGIEGRLGKSTLRQASLKLGVTGDDGPFHLETVAKADPQEALDLLRQLVKDKPLLQELHRIQSVSGAMLGRLALGGTLASVEPRVSVSEMNLSARYDRIPFPVTIGRGSFVYDQEQITVKDLTGTVGQSTFSGMDARIDRGPEPRLAVRSGTLFLHAAEMHGWLASLKPVRTPLGEIASASGSITISSLSVNGPAQSPEAWAVSAAGSSDSLTVSSPDLPEALSLSCRSFSYDPERISVKGLSATMGRSSVAGLEARLDPGTSPHLDIRSAQATIDAGEIYRWLASKEKMKAPLRKISAVGGGIVLSTLALKGPLSTPEEWQFMATGMADDLVIRSPSLPDLLAVRSGKFTLTPGLIVLDAARVGMLDAAATLSGSLMVSPEGLRGTDVLIDGNTGPAGMQWIKTFADLPRVLKVQQRIALSRGHFVSSDKGPLSFRGEISTQGGRTLSLDLVRQERELKINKLEIRDAVSRFSLTLGLRKRSWETTFSGRLDLSTVAALVDVEPMPAGRLAGDFSARILRDRPRESLAHGSLSGEGIVLPWKPDIPLQIDAITLGADGGRISIPSSRIRLAETVLSSSGILTFGKDGLDVQMDVAADRVEWGSLERVLTNDKAATPAEGRDEPSTMPIRGSVNVTAREFVYGRYTLSPLHADISFTPERATAHIRKAALCGINAEGRIELAGGHQNMEMALSAKDQDAGPAISCLTDGDTQLTGRFNVDGTLSLSLSSKPPLRGLDGTLSLRVRDGRINRSIPLTGLLSLLTPTEYFKGLPDLQKEGLSFSTFTIDGDIRRGVLSLKDTAINGSTMLILAEGTVDLSDRKMDVTMLAAPFKTLDSMFKILPERKGDRLASLVAIGVKMTGDIRNPDFSLRPITGIGTGLIGVMQRILKTPVRIIESLIPIPRK